MCLIHFIKDARGFVPNLKYFELPDRLLLPLFLSLQQVSQGWGIHSRQHRADIDSE